MEPLPSAGLRDALAPADALWLAEALPPGPPPPRRAATTRWDIACRLREAGWTVRFGPPAPEPAGVVVATLPKERALIDALVDQAGGSLAPGGRFVAIGRKDAGADALRKRLADRWGPVDVQRDGPWRTLTVRRPAALEPGEVLRARPVARWDDITLHGVPGAFAWDRVDGGTARLLQALADERPVGRWLDLGCGTGLLAAWAARAGADVTATDRSALALAAAEATLAPWPARIVPSDAGDGLDGPYDGVLCNPPFHDGSDTDWALIGGFVTQAARLLRPGGVAWFVVNAFVPFARAAEGLLAARCVADDGRFRVWRAAR